MKTLVPLAEEGKINTDASITDSQSIIIKAPINEVWDILTDIENWPSWNPDIKSVEIDSVEVGNEFKWNIVGSNVHSILRSINKPDQISWTGSTMGLKAIHVWKLEETEPNETIVSTQESIQGFLSLFMGHQKLHSTLLNWLDHLKQRAEKN